MLFQQTSAPTGWTKQTTHNNKALRVVSGAASSGGSVSFTTAFASGLSASNTTLSTSELPSHTHTTNVYLALAGNAAFIPQPGYGQGGVFGSTASNATGGGGAHNHTLPSFDVQYVDLIIASKD
jgi:microcystin-dependent protein